MMNYTEVLEHLNKESELSPNRPKWGLENIQAALQELEFSPPSGSIQVVGTNGKGTTSFLLSQILSEQGYQVGLFTSPHLITVRERIQVNEKNISVTDFTENYAKLKELFERHDLFYFESLVVLAWSYFCQEKVDYMIWETGLGGRFDAVSAMQSSVLAITAIDIDHKEYLGETLEEIVREKLCLLKNAKHVFSAEQSPAAQPLIANQEEEYQKKITYLKPTASKIQAKGTAFSWDNQNFTLAMFGHHYAQNACLALGVANHCLKENFSSEKARQTIAQSSWPGRLDTQTLSSGQQIIFSCAHNEASLKADLETIKEMQRKKIIPSSLRALFACTRQRPATSFLKKLQAEVPQIITTLIPGHEKCYEAIPKEDFLQINFERDPRKAFSKSLELMKEGEILLVIGSIYLCGIIWECLEEENR